MKVKNLPYKPRIQKKSALLYLTQIIITVVFLYLTVYAAKNPRIYSIDYGTGNTDYVNYNGTELSVKDGLDTGGGSLSFDIGNFTALPAGSYTMVVNYDADFQQQLFLSSSSSWFITKVIYLSPNKTSGTYDFYAAKDLEDLRCTILGYSQGALRISNLQVVSNNHNYRLMLFIWLLLCILTDVCLSSHWIKESHCSCICWRFRCFRVCCWRSPE